MNRTAPRSRDTPTRLVTISQVLSLAGALTEAVGVQDVVELVADEIAPAVGSQGLVVLGSRAGRLQVLGHRGYPDLRVVERYDGMPLSVLTPGGQALRTGVPAFFETREEMERLYPALLLNPSGFAAWAYLPLIASGRPVGTCVLSYAAPHHFATEERSVLTSLAGLIAQALERALLYDAKHRLAHGLQEALLPHTLPPLAGIEAAARYLPATQGMEIGGDFYDLVPAQGMAAAVIGDVQGHNVTAAGLMGQVRTAVRAYTAVGQPPEEVMRSTDQLLFDLGSELFASCLYLRLDPAHGPAAMSRAGSSAAPAAQAGRAGAGAGPRGRAAAGHRRLGGLSVDRGRPPPRFAARPLHRRPGRIPRHRLRGGPRRPGPPSHRPRRPSPGRPRRRPGPARRGRGGPPGRHRAAAAAGAAGGLTPRAPSGPATTGRRGRTGTVPLEGPSAGVCQTGAFLGVLAGSRTGFLAAGLVAAGPLTAGLRARSGLLAARLVTGARVTRARAAGSEGAPTASSAW
ncbi:hypothetical protein SGRIM128S_06387 [Streptomyces griseomycini]